MVGHHGGGAVLGEIAIEPLCCAQVNSRLAHVLNLSLASGGERNTRTKEDPNRPRETSGDHQRMQRDTVFPAA